MTKIYLAGKAYGQKWDLIKGIDPSKCSFVASDSDEETHGERFGHGDSSLKSYGYGQSKELVMDKCLLELVYCDYMIAYIDQEGQYGTIAEIGFYSAITRDSPCYLIIQEPEPEADAGADDYEPFPSLIKDSCWFASNFPKVIPMMTNTFEKSKELVRKIALIESPIEYKFWNAFVSLGPFHHGYLQPQFSIGKYRADFLFKDAKIIVELDGHDYHSSKEQRTYDAQRDRFIAESGYQVIRFTGSEVFKDAEKCAAQLHKLGLTAILGKRAERVLGSES